MAVNSNLQTVRSDTTGGCVEGPSEHETGSKPGRRSLAWPCARSALAPTDAWSVAKAIVLAAACRGWRRSPALCALCGYEASQGQASS